MRLGLARVAGRSMEPTLRPGDLVLVKSSNGVGLAALGERLATADAVAAPSASPKESRP